MKLKIFQNKTNKIIKSYPAETNYKKKVTLTFKLHFSIRLKHQKRTKPFVNINLYYAKIIVLTTHHSVSSRHLNSGKITFLLSPYFLTKIVEAFSLSNKKRDM